MDPRRGDSPRAPPTEPALRAIMRRLREIMADASDGQTRLDRIVKQVAGLMVAEVCSLYLKRQDGSLELFATEGLKPEAVHKTRMKRGEGLVGRCAELETTINEPEARNHPAFSYRPETGEEIFHSLLAVPLRRSGKVLGVLVVQNRMPRTYSEDDVESLQTTAMVIAEHIVSGAVAGAGGAGEIDRALTSVMTGEPMSDGIALGHAALHQPRVVVTRLLAEDPDVELARLETAVAQLREWIDKTLSGEGIATGGAHRDVLEAYRMFANDRGWLRRLKDAVREGLTADAAVERVHNATRARMLGQNDPFWRERLGDLDDLSDRLLRVLSGEAATGANRHDIPADAILVARTMGPAELLDYDRTRLRGLVIEDGSGQSHVAIVARALGIAAVGQASGIMERVAAGDPIIVDAETGELHLRPSQEVISAYSDKVRFRARRQVQYAALRDKPAVTRDGVRIMLHMNAGLPVDLPHLDESGADGIGLFRTELQFMIASSFPRLEKQTTIYRQILDAAGERPVVFRALDVGGDKTLPYLRMPSEDNPALGWRAVRLSLDRPALLRLQIRALLRAAGRRSLDVMLPMISAASEIDEARRHIEQERMRFTLATAQPAPRIRVGAMIEVPSMLFDLDHTLPRIDFASVGSNDLMQFLFAADRSNPRVAGRYDPLSVASLRALRSIVEACGRHEVPLNLCGELAGRPLEAMVLVGLGFRSISMAPASIGPVKAMILSLDAGRIAGLLEELMARETGSLRSDLQRFAEQDGVEL